MESSSPGSVNGFPLLISTACSPFFESSVPAFAFGFSGTFGAASGLGMNWTAMIVAAMIAAAGYINYLRGKKHALKAQGNLSL